MDGTDIAQIIEAGDTMQGIIILLLLCVFGLLWKYGKQLLDLTAEGNERVKNVDSTATQISEDIVTNHGSKNLGDAVDRLTESVHLLHLARAEDALALTRTNEKINKVRQDFNEYVLAHRELVDFGRAAIERELRGRVDDASAE